MQVMSRLRSGVVIYLPWYQTSELHWLFVSNTNIRLNQKMSPLLLFIYYLVMTQFPQQIFVPNYVDHPELHNNSHFHKLWPCWKIEMKYIQILNWWIIYFKFIYRDQITTILSINKTFEVKFMRFTDSSEQTTLKVYIGQPGQSIKGKALERVGEYS